MNLFKCKMCGGDLEITPGSAIAICRYCGTQQTAPNLDNEKKANLYNRANRLRYSNDFDKAAGVFESIVAEFPDEAEAYWGLCLCKYGIEYVDDIRTGQKIPTCHRTSFESIFNDNNFRMAMEYAYPEAQGMYHAEAKEIDRLQRKIIDIAKQESPYDVFICYKETDNTGSRTKDSVQAQNIYDALTDAGYKVFFARISLEDKLGQEYEPYIFSALMTAKIMLVVGTNFENMNSVWVKNEWGRFLQIMQKERGRTLIPCFSDMDAYDMPEEFRNLQAQDMNKVGFIQDLVRGIGKILNKSMNSNSNTKRITQREHRVQNIQKRKKAKRIRILVGSVAVTFVLAILGALIWIITNSFIKTGKVTGNETISEANESDLSTLNLDEQKILDGFNSLKCSNESKPSEFAIYVENELTHDDAVAYLIEKSNNEMAKMQTIKMDLNDDNYARLKKDEAALVYRDTAIECLLVAGYDDDSEEISEVKYQFVKVAFEESDIYFIDTQKDDLDALVKINYKDSIDLLKTFESPRAVVKFEEDSFSLSRSKDFEVQMYLYNFRDGCAKAYYPSGNVITIDINQDFVDSMSKLNNQYFYHEIWDYENMNASWIGTGLFTYEVYTLSGELAGKGSCQITE